MASSEAEAPAFGLEKPKARLYIKILIRSNE